MFIVNFRVGRCGFRGELGEVYRVVGGVWGCRGVFRIVFVKF